MSERKRADSGEELLGGRDGRVWYEFATNDSKASRLRLLDATMKAAATLSPHCFFGISGHVKIAPVGADEFSATAQLVHLRYSPPTYFDNGTLRGIYDSPEDELSGKQSAHYIAWQQRQAEADK